MSVVERSPLGTVVAPAGAPCAESRRVICPEGSASGVRVEGVDAVMFGGYEDDVVGAFCRG